MDGLVMMSSSSVEISNNWLSVMDHRLWDWDWSGSHGCLLFCSCGFLSIDLVMNLSWSMSLGLSGRFLNS